MRKGKALLWIVLGVLIFLGIVTLCVNVAYHLGVLKTCVVTREWSVPSPHDSSTVSVTMTTCGGTRNEIRVRLDAASKVYQLFSAVSPSPDRDVRIAWRSATHVELQFGRDLQVEFPPQIDEVKHHYGGIEVTYTAM